MRIKTRALAMGIAMSVVTCFGHGQTRDPVAAEALFRAGREAMKQKDYKTACPRFAESNRLDPSLGTLLNLADCEEHVGMVATAWQHFRQVAQDLPSSDERVKPAQDRARALEPRLPKVSVKLAPGTPPGTTVSRDKVELGAGSLGLAIPIDPGPHQLVVRSPGRKDRPYDISVAEAESLEVTVEIGEPAPVAPPPPSSASGSSLGTPPPPPTKPPPPTAGYVLLGVGGVGIAVSAITGILVLGKKSTVDSECSGGVCKSQSGVDAADSGRTLSLVSTVSFVVGAAGLGAGAYLLLRPRPTGETTQVGIAPTPGGSRFVFQGTF